MAMVAVEKKNKKWTKEDYVIIPTLSFFFLSNIHNQVNVKYGCHCAWIDKTKNRCEYHTLTHTHRKVFVNHHYHHHLLFYSIFFGILWNILFIIMKIFIVFTKKNSWNHHHHHDEQFFFYSFQWDFHIRFFFVSRNQKNSWNFSSSSIW